MNKEIFKLNNPDSILFSTFDIELLTFQSSKKIMAYIQDIKSRTSQILDLQAFRIDSLLSTNQMLSAIYHAWNGFKNNITISNQISVEFLLYVSGQRQISKAIEFFGLEKEEKEFSLIIFHGQEIEKEKLISLLSEDKIIKNISNLTLTDKPEKRKCLANIFGYKIQENTTFLTSKEGFKKLENFILTSISNLVFEGTKSKINEPIENKQKG